MKVLILGGTGAMGMHLVSILAKNPDNDVSVTSRQRHEDGRNIRYIQGDGHDARFVESILRERFDAIVDFMAYGTDEFAGRYRGFLDGTAQYVFLSSSRVYADSGRPITEDSPRLLDVCADREYLATDEYALAKARQENLLFDAGRRNWTVIRPYITYAENRLQLGILEKEQWLPRAAAGRKVVFSGDIAGRKTTLTYGRDAAAGIAAVLGKGGAFGEAFHVTQGKNILWSEVWEIYRSVIERRTGKAAEMTLFGADVFSEIFPQNKYQIKYDRLFNRIFDSSKIARFVDVSKFTPPETGLRSCLEKLIDGGPARMNRWWSFEGRADRLTRGLASPREIGGLKNMARYYARRIGI